MEKFFNICVILFATVLIGCDGGGDTGDTNAGGGNIEGTWVGIVGELWSSGCSDDPFCEHNRSCEGFFGIEGGYTFRNGNWEFFEEGFDPKNMKGTHTISSEKIIMTITHWIGTYHGFDARFYSKNELEAALKLLGEYTDERIAEILSHYYSTLTYGYILSGNTLTLITDFFGDELILQKK